MRKFFLTAATAMCAATLAVLLAACKADDVGHDAASAKSNAAKQPSKAHADGVRRVTIAELKQMMDRGDDVVVVDVRTKEQFEQGRIKGAILMPTGEVATRADELPKDKQIVFYCA